jgi:hypothetical protein
MAFRIASSRKSALNGLVGNSTASAFIARTVTGMSPHPVKQIVGI